eukprot:TRINITY_DN7538_c0_g1_i1.p1 TRINITY_DN7538_c0_g1~~TRINITY_DN7538_c0_g1_i1.p1  ORF type:complete len:130 (+),score=20.73 TRINITY_DN7538_c0_g1_i1:807-1196(+)
MPYNYIMEEFIRERLNIPVKNSIIIFDEAHNVDCIAENSASMEIRYSEIQECLKELEILQQKINPSDSECKIDDDDILFVMEPIRALHDKLQALLASNNHFPSGPERRSTSKNEYEDKYIDHGLSLIHI